MNSPAKNVPVTFIKNLLAGRFLDHPLHIMLIHFPLAFIPLCAALGLYSFIYKNNYFAELGFYSGATGTVTGILAAIYRALDLIKIKDNKLLAKALLHGGLNIFSLLIFGVLIGLRFKYYPSIEPLNIWFLSFEIFAALIILFSGYLGGDLILKYGIGITKGNN